MIETRWDSSCREGDDRSWSHLLLEDGRKPDGMMVEARQASCCRGGNYDHGGTSAQRVWVNQEKTACWTSS